MGETEILFTESEGPVRQANQLGLHDTALTQQRLDVEHQRLIRPRDGERVERTLHRLAEILIDPLRLLGQAGQRVPNLRVHLRLDQGQDDVADPVTHRFARCVGTVLAVGDPGIRQVGTQGLVRVA